MFQIQHAAPDGPGRYNQICTRSNSCSSPAAPGSEPPSCPGHRSRTPRRKWQVFPGRNRFYCDGRIMMARQAGVFYLTLGLIFLTSGLFFAFECTAKVREVLSILAETMWRIRDQSCLLLVLNLGPFYHPGPSLTLLGTILEVVVCFFSVWSIVGLSGFHTYLISSNQTTNEDIKGTWSKKEGKDNYNPYSYGSVLTNCFSALCGPLPPSLIDRRGLIQADTPQTVSQSNGSSGGGGYASTQLHSHMCDQDQCIQSTKFVLQAAATPLLHSDPVVLAPLPAKTPTPGGPCSYLAPTQPSLPSCAGDVLTFRDAAVDSHCHHHLHLHHLQHHQHHFTSPEETPCGTPQGALPCHAHIHLQHPAPPVLYDPVTQDALHEDSVRGLVKLSSV
ncbi:PREDICTED: probable palmitoyltransferase ZDHHC14 [Cyprinodon variegatus]|uniref:probable palmitoyltransferase ZDHHC14 n=1 Tax=Cyprinodon variegatus TaxID=28743 RepID=UPI000742BDE5|nr:PREDICTED: probable palmitoyltransferase ZDHHC14 [Cyprinodon variegatus]